MKALVLFLVITFFEFNIYGQVGIGTTSPSSASMLEVSSTSDAGTTYKGFMPPRVPNVVARSLISPSASDVGLLVFVESSGCLQMWSGTVWINVRCTNNSSNPVLLGKHNFETVPADPNLPLTVNTSGNYFTGNGNTPNSPRFVSPVRGYGVNDGIADIQFGPVDASAYNSATFKFHLASFSANSNNGADATDDVFVSVSTNGGTTFSNEIRVTGNNNSRYDFNSTGIATVAYDGNNTPLIATSPGGDTTAGIAKIEITGIPNASNLVFKIIMKNNQFNEFWIIDDVEVFGL